MDHSIRCYVSVNPLSLHLVTLQLHVVEGIETQFYRDIKANTLNFGVDIVWIGRENGISFLIKKLPATMHGIKAANTDPRLAIVLFCRLQEPEDDYIDEKKIAGWNYSDPTPSVKALVPYLLSTFFIFECV